MQSDQKFNLKLRVEQLQNQVQTLRRNLRFEEFKARQRLSDSKIQINKLTHHNDQLLRNHKRLTIDLAAFQVTLSQKNQEVELYKAKLEKLRLQFSKYQGLLPSERTLSRRQLKGYDLLLQENDSAKEQLKELTEQMDLMGKQLLVRSSQFDQANLLIHKDNERLKRTISSQSEKLAGFQNQMDQLKTKVQSLNRQVQHSESRCQELQQQHLLCSSRLRKVSEQSDEKCQQYESRLRLLQLQCDSLLQQQRQRWQQMLHQITSQLRVRQLRYCEQIDQLQKVIDQQHNQQPLKSLRAKSNLFQINQRSTYQHQASLKNNLYSISHSGITQRPLDLDSACDHSRPFQDQSGPSLQLKDYVLVHSDNVVKTIRKEASIVREDNFSSKLKQSISSLFVFRQSFKAALNRSERRSKVVDNERGIFFQFQQLQSKILELQEKVSFLEDNQLRLKAELAGKQYNFQNKQAQINRLRKRL